MNLYLKKQRLLKLANISIVALSLITHAAYGISCLYGIDSGININFTTTLYDINSSTGQASNPRNTGIGNAIGLEWGPGGYFLYTVTTFGGSSSNPNSLYKINPNTGVSQLVGPLNIGSISEGDLAVHPVTGVLYGIGGVGNLGKTLYTIDWNSGQATIKGHPADASSDYSYLSFNDNGTLYAIDNTMASGQLPTKLVTLSPVTGQILTSQILTPALGGSGGMDFDPATGLFYVVDGQEAGSVYAGARALYTLNPNTNLLNLIGLTGLPGHFSGLVDCDPDPDVWVEDTPYNYTGNNPDTGSEPDSNMVGQNMWKSKAIWIRNSNDCISTDYTDHQNPEFGQTNYICVKVQNRGGSVASNTTVKVYWANPSTGLGWSGGNGNGNWTQMTNTPIISSLIPNDNNIVTIPWFPPNPSDNNNDYGHFCLLARLINSNDMISGEGSNIDYNVRNQNNIAWRNVDIVDLLANRLVEIIFNVRQLSEFTPTQLVLYVTNDKGKHVTLPTKVSKVTIGGLEKLRLNSRLTKGFNMQESPEGGLSAEMIGERASISIDMKKGEEHNLSLTFAPTVLTRKKSPEKFYLHVEQFEDKKEPVGGIDYELRLPKETILSVTLDTFTANAADGKITINWTTGTETNNAGFTLWRATPIDGQCSTDSSNYKDVRQVQPLVYSKSQDGVLGANYSEEDQNVEPKVTYCYGLEDVDYDGKRTFHVDNIISATLN